MSKPPPAAPSAPPATSATAPNIVDVLTKRFDLTTQELKTILAFWKTNKAALLNGEAVEVTNPQTTEIVPINFRHITGEEDIQTADGPKGAKFYKDIVNFTEPTIQSLFNSTGPNGKNVLTDIYIEILRRRLKETPDLYPFAEMNPLADSRLSKFLHKTDLPIQFRMAVARTFRDSYPQPSDVADDVWASVHETFNNWAYLAPTSKAPLPKADPPAPPPAGPAPSPAPAAPAPAAPVTITGTGSARAAGSPGTFWGDLDYGSNEHWGNFHAGLLQIYGRHPDDVHIQKIPIGNGKEFKLADAIAEVELTNDAMHVTLPSGKVTYTKDKITATGSDDDQLAAMVVAAKAMNLQSYNIRAEGQHLVNVVIAFAAAGLTLDDATITAARTAYASLSAAAGPGPTAPAAPGGASPAGSNGGGGAAATRVAELNLVGA